MRGAWTEKLIDLTPLPAMMVRVFGTCAAGGEAPLVLHLHGGAFQGGSGRAASCVPAILAGLGAVVVSADYPVGREHPFPAALDAAFAVLMRLQDCRRDWAGRSGGLFVAGEEAGGNLAAALALMARDRQGPRLDGQILFSPMLDPSLATCSVRDAEAGPVGCKWADGWHDYLGSPEKASHPYAAPAGASRLAGVAPALVVTAEDDPMRDESLLYAVRLRHAGVLAQDHVVRAPSGWPDALGEAGGAPVWAAEISGLVGPFIAAMRISRIGASRSDKAETSRSRS